MRSKKPSVHSACPKEFTKGFREILYENSLSYGARVFALAVLDNPPNKKVIFAKLARRFGVSNSTIDDWLKQLLTVNYFFLLDKQETNQPTSNAVEAL